MTIQAAFSVVDITPAIGQAVPGMFGPRASTGVLDPLQVRAGVIAAPEAKIAIVGVDAVSLRFDIVETARQQIQATCGIELRDVLIAANHTHSGGPANDILGTDSDEGYCQDVSAAIVEAVALAQAGLEEVEIATAQTLCEGWAFNRRFHMRSGGEATNPGKNNPDLLEPAGPVDPNLTFIACRGLTSGKLGIIANFACHSTVVGGVQFSGDYSAYWQRALQRKLSDDTTLVFLNGACGDINQLDFTNPGVRESGVDWAAKMGSALAEATLTALETAKFSRTAQINSVHGSTQVGYRQPTAQALAEARAGIVADGPWDAKRWQARDLILLKEAIGEATETTCPVDVIKVGDAVIAAAPWQPFCEFGLRIKSSWQAGPVLVATFANGILGYVPTPQAFIGGGYEPTLCRGSKLQPDAGDRIVTETQRLLGVL